MRKTERIKKGEKLQMLKNSENTWRNVAQVLSFLSFLQIHKLADCFKNKQGWFSALQMSHFKAFFLEEYENKQYIFETYFGFCLNNFWFCFLEAASAPSSKCLGVCQF